MPPLSSGPEVVCWARLYKDSLRSNHEWFYQGHLEPVSTDVWTGVSVIRRTHIEVISVVLI